MQPHNSEAKRFDELLSLSIRRALAFMDQAVDFDDQALTGAEEIHYEWTHRLLAAEPPAGEASSTKDAPE